MKKLLVLASFLLSACVPPKPPVPPVVPSVTVTVVTDAQQAVPALDCALTIETLPTLPPIACRYVGTTATFLIPPDRVGHGAHLHLGSVGLSSVDERVAAEGNLGTRVLASFVPLPRLAKNGPFFATEDGQRIFITEATSFRAYQRFLDDIEGLKPVFAQLRDERYNGIRVFGMARNLFDFNPSNYPQYWARFPEFVRFAESYGLYVDFVAFADARLIYGDYRTTDATRQEQAYWTSLGEAAQSVSNALTVSLVNEVDQGPNVIDVDAFAPLPGILTSHGSSGGGAEPPMPVWDIYELHLNGTFEWQRKTHNACRNCEPPGGSGIGEVSEVNRPDQDPSLVHHHDAARSAKLLIARYCFHSIAGRTSDLLADHELEVARAVVQGASEVSVECQPGDYRHPINEEGPETLRFYRRIPDPACYVDVRK